MNNNMFKSELNEQEMMTDVLTSQKSITDKYNTFTNECANQQIRNDFMNILNDEHKIQFEIFDEMNKRGWYPVDKAEQNQINQVKQKYISKG